MRILLLNQEWFKLELIEFGHEVLTCGFSPHFDLPLINPFLHIHTIIKTISPEKSIELVIVYDNSSPLMITGFDELEIPTIFYGVDTHHHLTLHQAMIRTFDQTLIAQKDYLTSVVHPNSPSPIWFPPWAPYAFPFASKEERLYNTVFIGTLDAALNPLRVNFFNELHQLTDVITAEGRYLDYFPSTKIVINQSVKGDLNFRVFEALMCGALLITERIGNGLLEFFSDGVDLILYQRGDAVDAAAKINDSLDNWSRSKGIAEHGHATVNALHLSKHRAEKLLNIIKNITLSRNRSGFAMLVNFLAAYSGLKKRGNSHPEFALILALKSLAKALNDGESLNDHEITLAITAASLFDQEFKSNQGQKVIYALIEAYPQSLLYGGLRGSKIV